VKPLALRSLLAVALQQYLQTCLVRRGLIGWDLPLQPILTSLRLDFKNKGQGLAYISALPKKFPTLGLQLQAMSALPLNWDHRTDGEANGLLARCSCRIEAGIWRHTRLEQDTPGQLNLRLAPEAVGEWLGYWRSCSEESLLAIAAGHKFSLLNPLHPRTVAQQLRSSSVMVVQSVYVRCADVLYLNGKDGPQAILAKPQRQGDEQGSEVLPRVNLDPGEQRVVNHLINWVDQVDSPFSLPRSMEKQSYRLAVATEAWLGSLPSTLSLSPEQLMLLQGVERALGVTLYYHWAAAPPKSL
jgi:hypothetical protein